MFMEANPEDNRLLEVGPVTVRKTAVVKWKSPTGRAGFLVRQACEGGRHWPRGAPERRMEAKVVKPKGYEPRATVHQSERCCRTFALAAVQVSP
jgi:hypothetical protein